VQSTGKHLPVSGLFEKTKKYMCLPPIFVATIFQLAEAPERQGIGSMIVYDFTLTGILKSGCLRYAVRILCV
jgi:hypothetical protein